MADKTQTPPKEELGIEYGDSGVRIFNGVIVTDEYRPELAGHALMRTIEEMRRGDATIHAGLTAVKMPIIAAEWFVVPGGEDAQDKAAAELIDFQFNDVLNWKNILTEILTMLEFGFSVFELVFDFRSVNGVDRIVITKIAFRKQTTIYAWLTQDGQPGITQFKAMGEIVSIPEAKLITFTHQQEGDNWQGVSILRSAYQNWYYKKTLYQIDAVGHERQSLGVVKIEYPTGATDTMREAARMAAQNVRANERAYIEQPVGWMIDFMDMKANTTKDPSGSIAHHDRQILKSMAVQYLDIGASKSSGARSSSQDQRKVLELQDQAIAYQIASKITEKIVKTVVDLNFNVTNYPSWNVDKIEEDSIVDLAAAVTSLSGAEFLTPSDEDEAHVRKLLRFPEQSEETIDRDRAKLNVVPMPVKDAADNKVDDEANADDSEGGVKASAILHSAKQIHAALTDKLYGPSNAA